MCTDRVPSMIGKYKDFIFLVKIKNSAIITTHCFIQQEILVAKITKDKMLKVLNDIIKIINYTRTRPLKTKIFKNYL